MTRQPVPKKRTKERKCCYCGEKIEDGQPCAHSVSKGAKGIFLCWTCYDNGYCPIVVNGKVTGYDPPKEDVL
jgi:hypothetical protein